MLDVLGGFVLGFVIGIIACAVVVRAAVIVVAFQRGRDLWSAEERDRK